MYEAKVRPQLPLVPSSSPTRLSDPCPARSQILKAEFWQKGVNKSGAVGPHYFVHYKGWKQTCVGFSSASSSSSRSAARRRGSSTLTRRLSLPRSQLGRVGPRGAPLQVQRGGHPQAEGAHRGATRARRRRARGAQGGRARGQAQGGTDGGRPRRQYGGSSGRGGEGNWEGHEARARGRGGASAPFSLSLSPSHSSPPR